LFIQSGITHAVITKYPVVAHVVREEKQIRIRRFFLTRKKRQYFVLKPASRNVSVQMRFKIHSGSFREAGRRSIAFFSFVHASGLRIETSSTVNV
jgi:hypothetical protein